MAERILIVGLNWIGDAIMSMPAIQAFRAENPNAQVTLLVKPYMKPLWEMHPVPDTIMGLEKPRFMIPKLKSGHFDKALILPNSFRSAYLPFMAGIPMRSGLRGMWRQRMLTNVIPISGGHQSNEYFPILAPASIERPRELPQLNIPESACHAIETKLPFSAPFITLMPGAARGASKMWPITYFEELTDKLLKHRSESIVFAGGPSDAPACEELAKKAGNRCCSVAGKTSLQEWAALLAKSRAAVANDSGGMHLAAAVGAPVVGIYGITDPEKTGPLAERYTIIQNSSVKSRDIARTSDEARSALESILPNQVFEAVMSLLEH